MTWKISTRQVGVSVGCECRVAPLSPETGISLVRLSVCCRLYRVLLALYSPLLVRSTVHISEPRGASEPQEVLTAMAWTRQVAATVELKGGTPYEICASTFAPGMQGAFWIVSIDMRDE